MRVPQEDYVILMGVTINLEVNARVQVSSFVVEEYFSHLLSTNTT